MIDTGDTGLAAFEAEARAAAYDDVLERRWAPHASVPTHSHPFDVHARVAQGEFWLTCEGRTRHLSAGDTFQLAAEVPHEERYGPDGAVIWAARRHPR
ncbi:cupin domain-containing protein [Piscinibacter sakaiensis]|uniref:Cupin type-2 domain-containing protein n=1 Tax=Piscinibacter sakaiensis TaxID=1547922 RepID=A0A0K8NXV7_PISS1|nr:cupin domain-containing protein [Piscinibacter sakaiensis]GAP35203.1 hypothetical protein ISF6_0794 [Piscinibacter sakaiensis]